MKFCGDRAGIAARLLVYSLLALCTAVWAGGENGPDDHDHDDGPNYFGFVKDTAGKTIRDAKVTADIKGRPSVVARTNAAGAYRIPGFGKNISPTNVTISCAKETGAIAKDWLDVEILSMTASVAVPALLANELDAVPMSAAPVLTAALAATIWFSSVACSTR